MLKTQEPFDSKRNSPQSHPDLLRSNGIRGASRNLLKNSPQSHPELLRSNGIRGASRNLLKNEPYPPGIAGGLRRSRKSRKQNKSKKSRKARKTCRKH